ncbi:hypothetical protein DIPPA_04669 [Diplonema papillatum]|nr:hypothetical protein DIPPA_04669 [Diplonema papillatum]
MVWWAWTPCSNGCGYAAAAQGPTCCKGCASSGGRAHVAFALWARHHGKHDKSCACVRIDEVGPVFFVLRNAEGSHSYGPFKMVYVKGIHLAKFATVPHDASQALTIKWGGAVSLEPLSAQDVEQWDAVFQLETLAPGFCSLLGMASKRYLSSNQGILRSVASEGDGTLWTLDPVDVDQLKQICVKFQPLRSLLPLEGRQLTTSDKSQFMDNGFLQKTKLVPQALVDQALMHINNELCKEGAVTTGPHGPMYVKSLTLHPSLTALFYATPVWQYVECLLGKEKAEHVWGAQVALRPPEPHLYNNDELCAMYTAGDKYHIDGWDKSHSEFTLLVGVTLTPAPKVNMGNFTVWPGSHCDILRHVRDRHTSGKGLETEKPNFNRSGLQLKAEPGDVVFAHHKLAHAGGPNGSSSVRYQVYFRVKHVKHAEFLADTANPLLNNIWLEYEGLA